MRPSRIRRLAPHAQLSRALAPAPAPRRAAPRPSSSRQLHPPDWNTPRRPLRPDVAALHLPLAADEHPHHSTRRRAGAAGPAQCVPSRPRRRGLNMSAPRLSCCVCLARSHRGGADRDHARAAHALALPSRLLGVSLEPHRARPAEVRTSAGAHVGRSVTQLHRHFPLDVGSKCALYRALPHRRTVFLPVKEAGFGNVLATFATFFVSGASDSV